MSADKTIIDIYAEKSNTIGHRVYFIGRRGKPVGQEEHIPWFTVYDNKKPSPIRRWQSALGVDAIEEIEDAIPLIYGGIISMCYTPSRLKVYRVKATRKDAVPKLAKVLMAGGRKAGLYNIIYEVRAFYDMIQKGIKLLDTPVPLAFLPNDEMIAKLREAVDKVRDLKVLVFDIEVLSPKGGFPKQGDPLLSITYSTFRLGTMDIFRENWAEKNIKPLLAEKPTIKASVELVEEFLDIVRKEQPDYIISYNGSAFDIPYLYTFKPSNVDLKPLYLLFLDKRRDKEFIFPHIDLMLLRQGYGSTLGLRSTVAYALDDVALEVMKEISGIVDISWLFNSKYVEAERKLNHAKLKEYFENKDPLFYDYIVADVLLTSLLARIWMFALWMLSLLTGVPPSVFQRLAPGQLTEYFDVEWLRRFKFYPELREKQYEYRKVCSPTCIADTVENSGVYGEGKVYVKTYGVFENVLEGDYAQLYPTDMVSNTVDPTAIFIAEKISVINCNTKQKMSETLSNTSLRIVREKKLQVVLGERPGKNAECIEPRLIVTVVPGYGPLSFLHYKMYVARKLTKKFKKEAKQKRIPELLALDKAMKIVNNSNYGNYGKSRGNLISELVSASVFWRTQLIKHDTIELANKLAKGRGEVLYADTDSIFMAWRGTEEEFKKLLDEITREIQKKYGKYYEIEFEDKFDFCLYPKKKDSNEPSGKSYICFKDGEPAVIKGEFYKVIAPIAVKEMLPEFYKRIIMKKPKSKTELYEIIRELIWDEPLHKWFVKKSVSSFINQDDPSLLKNLNRDFHYAALFTLYMYKSDGVVPIQTNNVAPLDDFVGKNGLFVHKTVKVRIDPRQALRQQRAVIVLYLPSFTRKSREFYVYYDDDGEKATIYHVLVENVQKIVEGEDERTKYEKYYEVTFRYKEYKLDKKALFRHVMRSMDRYIIDDVMKKLIPILNTRSKKLV